MTAIHEMSAHDLRLQVARLRQQLAQTTADYRDAVAQHDAQRAIPLLRSRSQLMRQLLDTQCELLLSLRSEVPPVESAVCPAGAG